MKTLGTTVEGNYIVEMTADEHFSFIEVEASINGRGMDFISYHRQSLMGENLAPIFKALHDLSDAKMSINRIKEYVNFLDGVFGNKK